MNILIVEDADSTARFISDIFVKLPIVDKIDRALCYEQAIQRYHSRRYDVIITDINLDGTRSGHDLCRAIRKQDSKVVIVVVTGYSAAAVLRESFDAGANDYIRKPLDRDEIRERVMNWWQFIKCGKTKKTRLSYHDIDYIFSSNSFQVNGENILLTPKSKKLLLLLLTKPEKTISHQHIQSQLWGDHDDAFKERN
ncbi:MAG: response regulator, partial [Psychrosphaera sp.]|nr:response regulator [Psychrosphaera sp.]